MKVFILDDHSGPFWLESTQIYKQMEMVPNLDLSTN